MEQHSTETGVCLCLHGHFYQPHREKPWLEEIELQDSARPFHDWNEKIHYECYRPNSLARVLDERHKIVDIVNNYEKISFNFGPTLMSWLEAKHPETYREIVRADEVSRTLHRGHGNAIAQVYNHMIMPLANHRDKVTQVRWGIEEFRHRFGRDPESIWLAETGCNEDTLEVLVEAGMKFVILDPTQAEAVRPLAGEANWYDVSAQQIDPKYPYRCFLKNKPEKFIDIFFYDGAISREIGFGVLLMDAKNMIQRFESAKVWGGHPLQLIHVASDGETYGHHKPYADRVMAYLLNVEVPKRGYRLVNYGEFLELYPPQSAVRIKSGENGEGTSWSCQHGVRRWKDHCGCQTGGPQEWTQHWRKPLRESLDWLRDEAAKIFEEYGSQYLTDVWGARDDYISVILDRSEKNIENFFVRNQKHPLDKEEKVVCLKLLEMQRYAMLMYTSCGWFFAELSRIETVQILQYAARVLQLVGEISQKSLEHEFLKRLEVAKSNLSEFKDGRGVYEKLVKPRIVSFQQIASAYAICSVFDDGIVDNEETEIYCYRLRVYHRRKETLDHVTFNFGRICLTSKLTLEQKEFVFAVVQLGLFDFRCSIQWSSELSEFETLERELFEGFRTLHIVELLRRIDFRFGKTYYTLRDLPQREQAYVISRSSRQRIGLISDLYEKIFEENRQVHEVYRSMSLTLPPEIGYAAEYALSKRLLTAVTQLGFQGFNLKKAAAVNRILELARSYGVSLRKDPIVVFLNDELNRKSRQLAEGIQPELVHECLNIYKLAKKLDLKLDLAEPQNNLFRILKSGRMIPPMSEELVKDLSQLVSALAIQWDAFFKALQQKIIVA
ncbi:MAG: DUF3536 domain-containing protein [Candidatus Omnitrophica bacterium]|nr:DUF3536 domain-containing protein [Candidatus Omnitrophota bacterium]